VIIDLDQAAYRVERCEGQVRIRRGKDKDDSPDAGPAEPVLTAADPIGGSIGGAAGARTATCAPAEGELGKPHPIRTKRGVKVNRVYVGHLDDPVTEGQVVLNFFPMGYAERAVIELVNGDGDTLAIVIHPASGRVEVKDAATWRGAEDYVRRDDEGKEVEP
jgi:hypothetical protein